MRGLYKPASVFFGCMLVLLSVAGILLLDRNQLQSSIISGNLVLSGGGYAENTLEAAYLNANGVLVALTFLAIIGLTIFYFKKLHPIHLKKVKKGKRKSRGSRKARKRRLK